MRIFQKHEKKIRKHQKQIILFLLIVSFASLAMRIPEKEENRSASNGYFGKQNAGYEGESRDNSENGYEALPLNEMIDIPEGVYDPKEVEEAADFASEKTGVRKDFLMGMLGVETSFGRNTGQCTYGEVEKKAEKDYKLGRLSYRSWQTFQKRRDRFKGIAEGLGYDYQKLKVSCSPANYAGTGGAMGAAQFMPDTWLEYRDRIKEATGKENPDPWDLKDAVTAMALKLADVRGVTDHNYWSERAAAKIYLSGSTSWRYDWYANQAMYWSKNYRSAIG